MKEKSKLKKRRFRPRKYESVLLYIISKFPWISRTKLAHLLYYADMSHYGLYGEPLTGERYYKDLKRSIVPGHLSKFLSKLQDTGRITIKCRKIRLVKC